VSIKDSLQNMESKNKKMMGKNSIETHVIELHEKHANSAILTSK
jgi:hypothetical protein